MWQARSFVSAAGFHDGELAVQRQAGVTTEAARLTGMLAPADLRGGIGRFLAGRTFAALTARDRDGRLWISPLAGPAGFLRPDSATGLEIATAPVPGDPLHGLTAGQPAGLLVMEFAGRRRVRVNGTLVRAGADGLRIEAEQAYGNCPQYIGQRFLEPVAAGRALVRRTPGLSADDRALIRAADTFLLGTTHPDRGNDASHRGGTQGFVRVENGRLWWPDYPGNNMFNSFGNLAVDPAAALLVADFGTGRTLHLSGTATVDWTGPGIAGDDGGTGRRVWFTPQCTVAGTLLPARAVAPAVPYPASPPLRPDSAR
jgi:predicted pyridoxine 5'-phosphate oxidase superfamily flavin-nucleotide-binding protein